jgi:triacylglycerol esterase/lipase EstA (alpha/beta hydrolase family)
LFALLIISAGGCASTSYLSVRKTPRNPLTGTLNLASLNGPEPSQRTEDLLQRYDLYEQVKDAPADALQGLQQENRAEPTLEKTYALAELSYVLGKRAQAKGNTSKALELYSGSVSQAYLYLFSPQFDETRSYYDPQFRKACDLYNTALEDLLRIVNAEGRLQPGETYTLESGEHRIDVRIVTRGLWGNRAFDRFEFVSDYRVQGLQHRHVNYGLGVPLIAVRRGDDTEDPASSFYPRGMSVPVTAILRAVERPCLSPDDQQVVACALELQDPLASGVVEIAGRFVPLQSDLTTPLGFYLDNPEFRDANVATAGLLDPNQTSHLRGLYMLEAFDPRKIPVLMVHGLWSSPETWTEMINDLRALPEVRDRYQFWTYLYPTGQPFWISAAQMREDLAKTRQMVDPNRRWESLDQMVLIGHSMGGLVSRMQTLESGDDFWRILTDRSFDELQADDETRERLASTIFFEPNPSVRRVITIGTPHRGSYFANDYTRWVGRKLIKLPASLVQVKTRVIRENPDFFNNTELLTVTTSIDSLSPDSPVLPVMLSSKRSPTVTYHNIVGVISKKKLLARISEKGDGVVPYSSAHLDDVDSEIVVDADHVTVHQHPRSILEVRRILLQHSAEMYAETARRMAIPAAYGSPLPLPPVVPAAGR